MPERPADAQVLMEQATPGPEGTEEDGALGDGSVTGHRLATGRRGATVSIRADLERRVSGVGLAFPPPT